MTKARNVADLGSNDVLETTSTGIDVTGTATMDGLTVAAGDGNLASFKNSGANGHIFIIQGSEADDEMKIRIGADTSTYSDLVFSLGAGAKDSLRIADNNDISFYEDTGTTAKFFWDASAERLGIGTSSPSAPIHRGSTAVTTKHYDTNASAILEAGESRLQICANDDGSNGGGIVISNATKHWGIQQTGATDGNALEFGNYTSTGTGIDTFGAMTPRLRIDSSGNVGIGTSSPSGILHLSATNPNLYITSADTGQSDILMGGTSDPDAGIIRYADNDDSMRIFTNNTERMRIDSSGNLLVGKTSLDGNTAGVQVEPAGALAVTRSGSVTAYFNRKTSDGDIAVFRKDGTTVGSIGSRGGAVMNVILDPRSTVNGGAGIGATGNTSEPAILPTDESTLADNNTDLGNGSYRFKDLYLSGGVITSSDYRLKNDIQPMESSADKIKALNLVNFAWNESGEREDGFIAHELQAVIPSAVRGEKDAVNEEGDAQYQGVDPLKLIPVLTKALQEALTEIDNLKQRVNALENN